ncbi:alpha/beta hydrolase [Planococcus sp. ISL-109]|uniref:alpha/beta hydrolase n=1 Tax=Planococcus sp. ISL-109 TaxID=2819166 RepID=UPI001BE9860F|nr:alpha/beta hydrolase [Planococcus sp. ISL-109]MBT2581451.1 alpha/beta hydrolase [Planococcus sp. ISL-109]
MYRKNLANKKIISALGVVLLAWAGFVFADRYIEESPMASPIIGSAIYSPPPNIAEVVSQVEVVKDIRYHESDNAFMDFYYPKDATGPLPVVLWIHGGGFIGGSKDSRQDYGMVLANEGYLVANIDYALAPGQLYPGPVIQANEALRFLQQSAAQYGGDMKRIFVGGDSAGAQIASQLAALQSNPALAETMNLAPAVSSEQLRGALLFCGLYDMQTVRDSGFPNIDFFLNAYTGAESFEAFGNIHEMSTIQHVTSDYPDVFISAGDADPLEPQSVALADSLRFRGVDVTDVFFRDTDKNLKHEYQYALDTNDGQETLGKTLDFLLEKSQPAQ